MKHRGKYLPVLIISTLAMTISVILSCCADNSYSKISGTWYNESDLDGITLVITDDGTYARGEEVGDVSIEDQTLIFLPNYDEGMTATLSEKNGSKVLYDSYGNIWFSDYEAAADYHETIIAEKTENDKNQLVGVWEYSDLMRLTIRGAGTYEIISPDSWGFYESGTWESYRDGDYLKVKADVGELNEGTIQHSTSFLDGYFVSDDYNGGYWLLGGGSFRWTKAASGVSSNSSESEMTLEQYIKNDKDAMNSIYSAGEEAGMEVSIEGNMVVYSYDIAQIDSVTEEIALGENTRLSLMEGIAENKDTFNGIRTKLETETGIRNITIRVIYKYNGDILVTKDFS